MPLNDTALYHLINVGVRDMDAIDKPWDASTCFVRYAACLGDRLWTMVTREQNRVCVFCFFVLLRNCQGHSSLDAPSELNPPQRIPSPLLLHY